MSDQPMMRPALPAVVMAVVLSLAMTLWYLERELAVVWIGVGLMLPIAWGVLAMIRKEPSDEIRRSLFFAGLLLAFPLLFSLGSSLDLYNGDAKTLASRTLGLMMGGVLIFMGNYLPKRLPRLDRTKFDPARVQALHRFAGWAFVLAGIGYIGAWMVLPTVTANVIATGLTLFATLLILGRRALTRIRP